MLPGQPQPLESTYIFHTRGCISSVWRVFFQLLRKRWWGWEPCKLGSTQLGFKHWCRHPRNMEKKSCEGQTKF